MSSTLNSSSPGSRLARTKTKTFLEHNGQNLFRTVEKSWNNQIVWSQQSSKKRHILTIFPVLGNLTHMCQSSGTHRSEDTSLALIYWSGLGPYGPVSAGREFWLFNVLFFLINSYSLLSNILVFVFLRAFVIVFVFSIFIMISMSFS